MRKHIFKASLALVTLVVGVAAPAAAATTQQGLNDEGGTSYNWSVTAPRYRAIILNDWNSKWASQITAAGSHAFVYKDLTSTRSTDCGTNPGGGSPCIVNGAFCPPGVNDAPYYASGIGFCWAWRNRRSWFLRNASGRLMTEQGFPTQYLMDFGNSSYQAAWLKAVRTDATARGWRYVFADNALDNNSYGTPAKYPTASSVQAAMLSMLKVVGPGLRKAAIALVPNLGYTNLYPTLWGTWIQYVSGFANEHNVGNVSRQTSICQTQHKTCMFNFVGTTFTYL
jgi:Hypothetical glycosyl hydrolase family 15